MPPLRKILVKPALTESPAVLLLLVWASLRYPFGVLVHEESIELKEEEKGDMRSPETAPPFLKR
jgi:hypothetical protein